MTKSSIPNIFGYGVLIITNLSQKDIVKYKIPKTTSRDAQIPFGYYIMPEYTQSLKSYIT